MATLSQTLASRRAAIDAADVSGLGTAATTAATDYAAVGNNLSDLTDVDAAKTNLGITSTLGTLTKSFLRNETSTIALSAGAGNAPTVTVTKEVPQTGVSSSQWDVAIDGYNFERLDTAYATTITPSSATADGTFTLGTGSFAAGDVGKTIEGNGGSAVLTNVDGSYYLVTPFTDTSAIASGDWGMYATVFDATNGLELSFGLSDAWNVSTASYLQSFSVSGQEAVPQGLFFKPDGTKMYVVGALDDIIEYNLSTAWDVSTASYVQKFDTSTQETNVTGLFFKPDGTKMYTTGTGNDDVNEYNLSTAWNVSTASYLRGFSVSSQEANPNGLFFKPDGTKMYVVGSTGDDINEYNLSTAWNVSTSSYVQNFSVSAQDTNPQGLFFRSDGLKVYVVGSSGNTVNEYNLSTAWNVSTASYVRNFNASAQDTFPQGLFFKPDGLKMYVVGSTGDNVYEYNIGASKNPTSQYAPAITNVYGQIDSTFWTDINSMVASEVKGAGDAFYAVSTDNRTTWTVIDNTSGERDIVRNNTGTWEYNSNATYASTTWTAATTNAELDALQQALSVASNRMDKAQLEAVADANHYVLGDDLDLMVALYMASASPSVPSSNGVTIDYDANALNQGAVLGTDYEFDYPDSTTVRITSNAAQNLKVKVS